MPSAQASANAVSATVPFGLRLVRYHRPFG